MIPSTPHKFHIPVMGLGFTIDTPLKVARFGITSVISIVEDGLIEQIRTFYCQKENLPYTPISNKEDDYRANRITAYLNLVQSIIDKQIRSLKEEPFEAGKDIVKYFELLPNESPLKQTYLAMLLENDPIQKLSLQTYLRSQIVPGSCDVNIMSKLDNNNYTPQGEQLPAEYSDALAALRGFANSNLQSSIIFSAGYNPRLYNYLENFPDFFPNQDGSIKKTVILKVSDYRSAQTQGKILAKKGIWVAEFRIESGLNCGGHAFATDGLLLGPILESFKTNKQSLQAELYTLCNQALSEKGLPTFSAMPPLRITAQGGIGTHNENEFLFNHYQVDNTGWGSPFLLVPEVTNVDADTLQSLAHAKQEDYYLSNISPLGVPFNSFKHASSEKQRLQRIALGSPGSPCTKKFLSSNTEFTTQPICTASRKYQHLKIKQLAASGLEGDDLEKQIAIATQKDCLCEGLSLSALLKNSIPLLHTNASKAVTICPGPNLAFFSGIFSLKQMVDHIYGRANILNALKRPNFFINELAMYVAYFQNELNENIHQLTANKKRQLTTFKQNILAGIDYYAAILHTLKNETEDYLNEMQTELLNYKSTISEMSIVG